MISVNSYQPALCLHYVYTIESSICQGGHFYYARTMAETAASKIITLMLEPIMTNTKHYESQRLLQLQAVHCYDRLVCNRLGTLSSLEYSLKTVEGWHSFIMLEVMAVLGPALDQRFFPGHGDYDKCPEKECLMMAYARGAALATVGSLSREGLIKINVPSSTGSLSIISPQEYFDRTLLQQAINILQAFDAVVFTMTITNLKSTDRLFLVTMLKDALSYNPDLVKEFSRSRVPAREARRKSKLLVSPLPPEGATITKRQRAKVMQPSGSRLSIPPPTHNSVELIRQGLTSCLYRRLRDYAKDTLGKKEAFD